MAETAAAAKVAVSPRCRTRTADGGRSTRTAMVGPPPATETPAAPGRGRGPLPTTRAPPPRTWGRGERTGGRVFWRPTEKLTPGSKGERNKNEVIRTFAGGLRELRQTTKKKWL